MADRFSAWIIAALAAAYILTFPMHHLPMLVVFPVVAIGWFHKTRGGLTAGLLAILLDFILIYFREGENSWIDMLQKEAENLFLVGHLFVILAGWSVGALREMSDTRRHAEDKLYSRERYLTLLKIAVDDILNPRQPEGRYQQLLIHMANLFEADHGYFLQLDSVEEQGVSLIVSSALTGEDSVFSIPLKPGESPAIEAILNTSQVAVIENEAGSVDIIKATLFKGLDAPIHHIFCIPLTARGKKLGTVALAYISQRLISSTELNYAREASDQIALAMWTTQQEIELQRNLRESNSLSNIALALSETERIGLNDVLQLIVNSARELIPNVDQAVIHLVDEERETLVYGAVIGFDDPAGGKKKMRVGEGIAGHVVINGETLNITDVTTDPRFVKLDRDPTYRSLMVAPVHSGERKLGTISVSSNLPFAFNANDIKLLSQLGTQAAIAIDNAHLLESTQQALKEANALYRINLGLVVSFDPQELMKEAVELLQKSFGYYHVQIYVREPESGDFIMQEGSGEIGRRLKEKGHHLRAGEGIIGYAAETRQAFFTNDVDRVFFFTRNPLLPDTKSELAVPVIIENQIMGVLDVQQAPPASLSKRDQLLVEAVAGQLAVALQKANLYASLQAALEVEKAIRNEMVQSERLATMGRLLASVSHELNNPLQAIQNALFLLREEKGISMQGRLDLDIVLSETERMSALIERLRTTYRPTQVEDFAPTQINDIIEDVYALISTHLRHNEIAFEFLPDPLLPQIPTLTNQIRQVALNLFMNAVEAMANGGRLTVITERLWEGNEIQITITDTGTGIPPELLPNIFEAFVTNKQRGTGLGLTISYDIVIKHRGRITAENNPDQGSTFKIWLPINNGEDK